MISAGYVSRALFDRVKGDIDKRLEALKIPIGMIMMWSGSVASIPFHWQLCDGTGGTPDLRDKFIVGAGNSYNPGVTGGAVDHDHDAHTDLVHAGADVDAHAGDSVEVGYGGPTIIPFADAGDKSHAVTQPDNHTISAHSTESNLPPYYALCFIMRTS